MRRVYVRLRPAEVEALVKRAAEQRRRPADEAALLLAEALRRREQAEAEVQRDRRQEAARC